MKQKERVFHSILFELIAFIFLFFFASIITRKPLEQVGVLSTGLSLIAMVWSYVYNIIFDYLFGSERYTRTRMTRVLHGLGFEVGMILVSFPLLMYMLKLDFVTVFIMDIGVVMFFIVYTIIFNWAYDIIRQKKVA